MCSRRCAAAAGSTRSSSRASKRCAASSRCRRSRGSSAWRSPRAAKSHGPFPKSKPRSDSVITRESLLTLEAYAKQRAQFRAKVIEHKKRRTVHLGEHVTLMFEDELTIRYQVQEMLRIERIFEQDGIQHELDAYNPLIPDGGNWKATMLIEYPDPESRRRLRDGASVLVGIDHPQYRAAVELTPEVRAALAADLR